MAGRPGEHPELIGLTDAARGTATLDERAEVGEAPEHGATDELGRMGVKSRLVRLAVSVIANATAVEFLAATAES
jgi:hypothetical protein